MKVILNVVSNKYSRLYSNTYTNNTPDCINSKIRGNDFLVLGS